MECKGVPIPAVAPTTFIRIYPEWNVKVTNAYKEFSLDLLEYIQNGM